MCTTVSTLQLVVYAAFSAVQLVFSADQLIEQLFLVLSRSPRVHLHTTGRLRHPLLLRVRRPSRQEDFAAVSKKINLESN